MSRQLSSLLVLVFCLTTLGCQSPPTVPPEQTPAPPIQLTNERYYLAEDGSKQLVVPVQPPTPKPSPEAPIPLGTPPIDFSAHEWANFSQSGEDGVLEAVFQLVEPTKEGYVIEFGASTGLELSNARHWIVNRGWGALLLEGDDDMAVTLGQNFKDYPKVKTSQAWVYPGNVELLFEKFGAPKDFDILSIDIDSNDYYIWNALHEYRPKIVIMEYNASFPPPQQMVVEFSPFNYWDGSDYYGASLQSLCNLAKKKGYELLYCTSMGANAIFIDKKYFDRFKIKDNSAKTLYKEPQYGLKGIGRAPNGLGHPPSETFQLFMGETPEPAFKTTLHWDAIEHPKKRRDDL